MNFKPGKYITSTSNKGLKQGPIAYLYEVQKKNNPALKFLIH